MLDIELFGIWLKTTHVIEALDLTLYLLAPETTNMFNINTKPKLYMLYSKPKRRKLQIQQRLIYFNADNGNLAGITKIKEIAVLAAICSCLSIALLTFLSINLFTQQNLLKYLNDTCYVYSTMIFRIINHPKYSFWRYCDKKNNKLLFCIYFINNKHDGSSQECIFISNLVMNDYIKILSSKMEFQRSKARRTFL